MKVESRMLILLGFFFALLTVTYLVLAQEMAGGLMLLGTALLGFMPGLYYAFWHRRMGDRPEDREDGKLEDREVVVGSFPGSSIWPFVMGMGCFSLVLGLVFGIWAAIPGIGLVVAALVGGTVEGRHGGKV